jgi:hypothetical protein
VKIYFEKINPILGILHFPSFQQSLSDGLHFRDSQFGAVVLAACSLASRHSDDPRVFFDGVNSEHSCGWKWFRQVQPLRASFSPEPSLYQLQLISVRLILRFSLSVSTPLTMDLAERNIFVWYIDAGGMLDPRYEHQLSRLSTMDNIGF